MKSLVSNASRDHQEGEEEEEVGNLMALMSTDCNGFKMQCVAYISGYVLQMMTRFIKCDTCRKACLAQYSERHPTALTLFDYKQRRPLSTPSKDVTTICSVTENVITLLISKKFFFSMLGLARIF